jgi:signal transduction histidine kinase
MSSISNESSIPSLPEPLELDRVDSGEAGLVQTLFQENQSLREQIARHTELMQLLTHQLATPLTALSGSVHLLAETELNEAHRKEFLGVLEQQIGRLQNLLQDLMALRNVETEPLEAKPTRFRIGRVVDEVLEEFQSHAHPITCQISPDLPEVWADRWQVSQVLVNLLSNAIKYSPNQKPVEIGASLMAPGWLQIWVKDQGLGIPESAQPHLFERFFRVKHRDRQGIGGTGLGLSLCKLLVENQGGKMEFESTHGLGSVFYFSLPIWEKRGADGSQESAEKSHESSELP